jgi:PAS domain S-box-containing protein
LLKPDDSTIPAERAEAPSFLAGGGEMGALMRAHDWQASPLGRPEGWPQSLKTAVRIMLTSRQPIWIGWGKELIFFYNDPYKAIIGGKHPWALGRPTQRVWSEIWDDIGPLLATALTGIEGTFVEEKLLIMERNGYPEETYYTFSYSPVPDDDGTTGGIICANSDDTARVLGERQLSLLRELAASVIDARTWLQACEASIQALCANPHDIPFAMLYLREPGASFSLVAHCGIDAGHPAAPPTLESGNTCWPIDTLKGRNEIVTVPDLASWFDTALPTGAWTRQPTQAVLLPIVPPGEEGHDGMLIVALNPWRLFDDGYQRFLTLVAGQIASAIGYADAYEQERARAEVLAELDRAKTTFFSNISHEFRTPLTLMLGPLEELLSRPTLQSKNDRSLVEITHRNGLRLLRLVNALLDFSRIEAGRVDMRLAATEVASFTAELSSLFRSTIERAGLELVVECPPLARPVMVDRDMWEKVILNLMSNAFKFTPSGKIAVAVRAAGGETVEIKISDTGIGIPEHELPRLFERFHRVAGAQGRSIEGSGIGLALVHELVKMQGGTIRVTSQWGVGTSFTITMPFAAGEDQAARIEPHGHPGASVDAHEYVESAQRWLVDLDDHDESTARSLSDTSHEDLPKAAVLDTSAPKVLVADDNADLRDYMHRILSTAGYAVLVAADGQQALEIAQTTAPDLIVSDVMMPRLDGFGLLRALRADAALAETPVLLLSARAGEEAKVDGLEAGAEDYLVKPFSAREMLARVASNLQLARLRRTTENNLRTLNETLEQRVTETVAERDRLWEISEDLLVIVDIDGRLLRISPSWARMLGQESDELHLRPYEDLVHPDDLAQVSQSLDALREHGNAVHYENRMRVSDGSWRWIAWTLSLDQNSGQIHGVGRDVTADKEAHDALRHAEEALRTAQKMEAIGKLTGGVAHDFNNLLQVIGGNLQLLAKDVAGTDKPEQRVRNALAGVARGAKLASQLLAFGRRQPLAPKVVNLGRFVRGLDDMLRRALGDGIEIETIVSGGLWNTLVDPFQVENALLNLAINARDAMKGHGRLTIEAGNAALDDTYASLNPDVTPGQYVMMAVTDTGAGIPPEIMERVFEPFFTTKPEGQGTGLGLSMVYGFAKQSGGHIKLYSEIGQGTTVRMYLPRVRQEEDLVTEVDSGPVRGGTETVLVAEDDEDVRTTVVELLSDLGYRVLKAKDAQSALAIVESGVPVDLLFTDVVMPGPLRSPELARKARERLPDIAVLFTSGYTDNAIVHAGRLDEGIELLSKPYSREAMARKIRHVLRNQQQRNTSNSVLSEHRAASPSVPANLRSLKILLVEDDDLVRAGTAEMLNTLGLDVREARDGAAAMEVLHQEPIHVLIADVGLPDVSGIDLAIDALRRHPAMRVIFASGYDVVLPDEKRTLLGAAVSLRKPYNLDDLLHALERQLPQLASRG